MTNNASLVSDEDSLDAAETILDNATDFLNEGLTLLFSPSASSRTAKLAIVSIQTAIELLAKFRIVRELGLDELLSDPLPAGNWRAALDRRSLKTLGFSKALKKIKELEALPDFEESQIWALAALRNDLVHFAADVDADEIRNACASLLPAVFSIFAMSFERDDGSHEDYTKFLDGHMFEMLTQFNPYRAAAVDLAYEALNTEKNFTCFRCLNESFGLSSSDIYFCYCCGHSFPKGVVGFADCAICRRENGVAYDALNDDDGQHYGKCLHCDVTQWVLVCKACGASTSSERGGKHLACKTCEKLE